MLFEPGRRQYPARAVVLLVVFGAASTGGDAPRINDITTDLENPPKFALEPLSLLSSVRAESSGGGRAHDPSSSVN